tara:strand:+ start:18 stop:767 length:750 start_codon:yes stop_codon:yes gene_type:complete
MVVPDTDQRKLSNNLSFHKYIEFKNVSFKYVEDGPTILNNVNFKINKGSRVGFIGSTGSGKSTLVDIVMGLLTPNDGVVFIDDIRLSENNINCWQSKLCHVPQSIFLTDNTISENIAFGIEKELIDHERVKDAAMQAQISDFINNSLDGYDTIVGERGVKLSGGQRQRIAIARALYKDADVLVFDEATSALDISTEKLVMDSITTLDKKLTIIIIAHRITTLQNCDKIIEIENGEISYQGIYDNIPRQI